jgi:tRNA-specific 2-thiouridylase
VGTHDDLRVRRITATRASWTGRPLSGSWSGLVQVRAHGEPMPAQVTASPDQVEVLLESAATGIAPGQAAVLYEGDRVVGSATISGTHP